MDIRGEEVETHWHLGRATCGRGWSCHVTEAADVNRKARPAAQRNGLMLDVTIGHEEEGQQLGSGAALIRQ